MKSKEQKLTKSKNPRIPDPTYIGPSDKRNKRNQVLGAWRCHCGTEFYEVNSRVQSGHKRTCGCSSFQYRYEAGVQGRKQLFHSYQSNAEARDLVWDLSEEEFSSITSSNCYYCNAIPAMKSFSGKTKEAKTHNSYVYNGIDRKDDNEGYLLSNCVACCGMCNMMKRTYPYEAYIKKCKEVSLKWAGKV